MINTVRAEYMPPGTSETGHIDDIVLIYFHQYSWSQQDFIPYISYVDKNTDPVQDQWMFDDFLFLAMTSPSGHDFGESETNADDWKWLANKFFEENKQINALQAAAEELNTSLKIGIMIPYPERHTGNNFGDIDNDGTKENFSTLDGRYTAVKWYIDKILKNWSDSDFDNLELNGFYWFEETMWDRDDFNDNPTNNLDEILTANVRDYIHSKEYKFFWIPANRKEVAESSEYDNRSPWMKDNQNKNIFDFVIIQPNYYQNYDSRHYKTLESISTIAKQKRLGIEIEMNDQVMTSEEYRDRFKEYLEKGKLLGYRDNAVLAYYQDHKTIYNLAMQNHDLYNELFMFINGLDDMPTTTTTTSSTTTTAPTTSSTTTTNVPCILTNAYWSKAIALEGDKIQLIVEGNNCNEKILDLTYFEEDISDNKETGSFLEIFAGNFFNIFRSTFTFDSENDSINSVDYNLPEKLIFDGNYANGTWEVIWFEDSDGEDKNPELIFEASLENQIITSESLKINRQETTSTVSTSTTTSSTTSTTLTQTTTTAYTTTTNMPDTTTTTISQTTTNPVKIGKSGDRTLLIVGTTVATSLLIIFAFTTLGR